MYQVRYVCMYVCMYVSQGKLAVCQGVKMLSPSIFGMTGTDAMDAYLTGGGSIDQQRAALESPPPPAPPHHTYLHLPPHLHNHQLTQRKHNNHQNSHHE